MAEDDTNIIAESQSSLQEKYLNNFDDLEEGQLIEGTIIEIGAETVFVDVGYKSEGKIPIDEFTTRPKIGDIVNVILLFKEGKSGQVVVSKGKADIAILRKNLKIALKEKTPVIGKFISSNKGGFEVDLGCGVIGFCPLSKTDIKRVEKPEEYIGLETKFLIDRLYSDNKDKIIVSRRNFLENEISMRKRKFFMETKVGSVVSGEVKSFTSFGAFVDLGGFDGLLHINDMSWAHVTKPKDYVKKDQTIDLKVIKLEPEKQKIYLSLKHFTPDPWTLFESKYAVNDIIKGTVTKLVDFGAFIAIEEGIEGLVHISELSWVKRIKHPGEVLTIGDEVETKILKYDIESGRVSLGIKQVLQNPWDNIEDTFPLGLRLNGKIVKITNVGAFVELSENIDGFLHFDDLSWTKRIKNPRSMLKVDEEIEVAIIEIDKTARRIRLGVKQLVDDPWTYLHQNFLKNSIIDGKITNITDFGVFVKVIGGIEGLVNRYNLVVPGTDDSQDENYLSRFKIGQNVKALITEINPSAQRLSLSIKDYEKSMQKEELSKYIHDEDGGSTATFGDFLKELNNDSPS